MAPSVFTCSLPYAQKNKQTLKLERKRNRRTVQTNRARIRQHGDNSTAVRPVLNCRAIQHLRARGVKKKQLERNRMVSECSRKIAATERHWTRRYKRIKGVRALMKKLLFWRAKRPTTLSASRMKANWAARLRLAPFNIKMQPGSRRRSGHPPSLLLWLSLPTRYNNVASLVCTSRAGTAAAAACSSRPYSTTTTTT